MENLVRLFEMTPSVVRGVLQKPTDPKRYFENEFGSSPIAESRTWITDCQAAGKTLDDIVTCVARYALFVKMVVENKFKLHSYLREAKAMLYHYRLKNIYVSDAYYAILAYMYTTNRHRPYPGCPKTINPSSTDDGCLESLQPTFDLVKSTLVDARAEGMREREFSDEARQFWWQNCDVFLDLITGVELEEFMSKSRRLTTLCDVRDIPFMFTQGKQAEGLNALYSLFNNIGGPGMVGPGSREELNAYIANPKGLNALVVWTKSGNSEALETSHSDCETWFPDGKEIETEDRTRLLNCIAKTGLDPSSSAIDLNRYVKSLTSLVEAGKGPTVWSEDTKLIPTQALYVYLLSVGRIQGQGPCLSVNDVGITMD